MLKPEESRRRNSLREEKPYVYEKMVRLGDKYHRGESIAIIQFQYNYACNFQCEHCCTAKMQLQRGKRYFRIADVKELSRQADEMGLSTFVITGGEPLLFKDLDELVGAINPEKFWIAIDTNGWLLDDGKAKHLKDIGIDKVQLSLDGADAQTHDIFRRRDGSWDRCIAAIRSCKKAGLRIILQTVVWRGRAKTGEFRDFLELAKSLNVGTYVAYAKPIGAYEGRYDQMITPEDEAAIFELEKRYDVFTHLTPSYGIDTGCIAVKRMVSVTRYGDVMPCPYMHISLGNFFEEPLKDIIDSGLSIKWFSPKVKMPCLVGTDIDFVERVLSPTYGNVEIPVRYDKIFTAEDYIKEAVDR